MYERTNGRELKSQSLGGSLPAELVKLPYLQVLWEAPVHFYANFALIRFLNYLVYHFSWLNCVGWFICITQWLNPQLPQRFNSFRMGCNPASKHVCSLYFESFLPLFGGEFDMLDLLQFSARKPVDWLHPQRDREHLYSYSFVNF